MANFSDPKRLDEAARLRNQGFSLRQISKMTGLHRETVITHTGKISRSDSMKIYHSRRKGLVIDMSEFKVQAIVHPARFITIGAPEPIKPRDPLQERFQANLHLVNLEARILIRKLCHSYDLKTLEHFGTIGLWDACTRFTGEEASFPGYARLRIRGQVWDEIRVESKIPRRLMKADDKPRFEDIEYTVIQSNSPTQDKTLHFRNILQQVDSIPFSDRERQVIEALASGDKFADLATSWGVSEPLVSQTKARALLKMTRLIREADLE